MTHTPKSTLALADSPAAVVFAGLAAPTADRDTPHWCEAGPMTSNIDCPHWTRDDGWLTEVKASVTPSRMRVTGASDRLSNEITAAGLGGRSSGRDKCSTSTTNKEDRMGYATDVAEQLARRQATPATIGRRRAAAEVVRNLETTLDGAIVPAPGSASKLRETAAPVPHD